MEVKVDKAIVLHEVLNFHFYSLFNSQFNSYKEFLPYFPVIRD